MVLITWSNIFSTGISSIDVQHKVLVDITNQLYDMIKVGNDGAIVERALMGLVEYTHFHFDYEHELMDMIDFAEAEEHQNEHQKFINIIEKFKMDFELGNANVSVELLHLLRNWLTNHIMKSDKTLGKALSDKGYK